MTTCHGGCLHRSQAGDGACFSADRRFRYALWRIWNPDLALCAFVMLNPSIADETVLDPTVTRALERAKRWGYGGIVVGNISPLVSTDRHAMFRSEDRSGEHRVNDSHLAAIAQAASRLIFGYGAAGGDRRMDRLREHAHDVIGAARFVAGCGEPTMALKVTKDGWPQHPLYIDYNAEPVPFDLAG